MNVLVSDISESYINWVIVRSLQDVIGLVGNVENLVYHKSKESSSEKIRLLSEVYSSRTNCKIIYICNKDKVDNAIRMLVTGGLNGKYIDDEFFLESERELNTLISDLSVIVDSTELASSHVLLDFFNRYLGEGSSGISKGYLQVVKNAAIEMTESYHSKSLEILEMSESAAEVFSHSVDLISQMREQQESLEKDISNLKEKRNELDHMNSRPMMGSSVMFYPTVSYLKNKNIIRIKDIGRCQYLTSFMFGFREYLEKIKNIRPKLIIVESFGMLLEDRYKSYKWVTSSNKNDSRNFYDKIVFTNCPTSIIISKLLDDTDYDTFIVLDRTLNYKNNVINSRGIELYSVVGESTITKYKLPRERCFSSVNKISKTMFTIPYFSDYPIRDDQRVNRYLKDCFSLYEIIYSSKLK